MSAWYKLESNKTDAAAHAGAVVHEDSVHKLEQQCPNGAVEVESSIKWKAPNHHSKKDVLRNLLMHALV